MAQLTDLQRPSNIRSATGNVVTGSLQKKYNQMKDGRNQKDAISGALSQNRVVNSGSRSVTGEPVITHSQRAIVALKGGQAAADINVSSAPRPSGTTSSSRNIQVGSLQAKFDRMKGLGDVDTSAITGHDAKVPAGTGFKFEDDFARAGEDTFDMAPGAKSDPWDTAEDNVGVPGPPSDPWDTAEDNVGVPTVDQFAHSGFGNPDFMQEAAMSIATQKNMGLFDRFNNIGSKV